MIFGRRGFQSRVGVIRDGQDVTAVGDGTVGQLVDRVPTVREARVDVGFGLQPDATCSPWNLVNESRLCAPLHNRHRHTYGDEDGSANDGFGHGPV